MLPIQLFWSIFFASLSVMAAIAAVCMLVVIIKQHKKM